MTALRALLIPVGDDVYAVDAATVREVVVGPPVARVPTAARVVLGVFNLRGEVVPLFDTAAVLGVGNTPTVAFAVVVSTSIGLAGLVVSGLPRVVMLEDQLGPSELHATLGMYLFSDGVAVLLDIEALLLTTSWSSGPVDMHGSAG